MGELSWAAINGTGWDGWYLFLLFFWTCAAAALIYVAQKSGR